jgi:hypothetical protein
VYASHFEIGFDPGRLVTFSFVPNSSRAQDPTAAQAFRNALVDQVRQVPGVKEASLVSLVPFSGRVAGTTLANGVFAMRNESTADYFATVGLRVLRGRTYTQEEVRGQAPVAVVSERLARAVWGSDDPIGASMDAVWGRGKSTASFTSDDSDAGPPSILRRPPGTVVIGVVSDATVSLKQIDAPVIYLPLSSKSVPRLVLSTDRNVREVADAVKSVLDLLGAESRVTLMKDQYEEQLGLGTDLAMLAGVVGVTALGLSVIGLLGVTAFSVAQRRQEISIRLALGATRGEIVWLLLRQSLRPVGLGLLVGVILAWGAGFAIRSVLLGISAQDPIAIGAAICVLLTTATAAIWWPARRAARANPAEMLKQG